MSPFARHTTQSVLLLISVAALAYMMGGVVAMLVFSNIFLALWLSQHLLYIAKLLRWLPSPKWRLVPEGRGVWREVFQILLMQAKSRKKRKQKLSRALQRFNRAAEAMPNGVIILNQEGRIEWMNRLAATHLNLDIERDWMGILSNLVRTPEFHLFLQQPLMAEPHCLKINITDGKHRHRVLALTRLAFEARAELLITQDISAAEQLNATRTAFVANVSHELRTPLTVINGFLETLIDTPNLPTEQRQQFMGLMQKEGQRMLNLLADLLTLSRLESHHLASIETHPVNLSMLAEQLQQEAQTLSQGRHHIQPHIQPDIWVAGIQTDLYSAFSNLVFNAVRYTPEGGHIDLKLIHKPEEGEHPAVAVFSVHDTGPGIAPEHIPHLTERFYRVDAGRFRQSGGTGLGLAITKHALAEHQGTLDIQSEVGVGSVFSATIPLKTVLMVD